MSSFKIIKTEVSEQIQKLTHDVITTLSQIWTKSFDLDLCEVNLRKLPEHVSIFYEEVIVETKMRQETIIKGIRKLREEGEMIRRLLNVDVDLSVMEDVPLYTEQMRLDESLHDLRERLAKRKDQIYELLLEQDALCDELGEPPRPLLDDPLPTEMELQDFSLHLDALRAIKNNRIYMISTCRREIKNFMAELEMPIQTEEEEFLLNDRTVPLTQNTVDRLKHLHNTYVNQMEQTRESIENMKKKLNSLWECLEVSPSVRNKFSKYTNYSQTTYDRYYCELQRCEGVKRQNIKKFVDKLRDEILIWWGKTLKSDLERSRFTNFTNDCYTEDLLALHEMELEDLKRFYTNNEKIFELIWERKTLWDRMIALEAKASEPGRYNNRGGNLLKEEKERKTIATKLPKIEQELTELVEQYEKQHNRKFTIFGDNILEIISMEWEEKRAKKEQLMSARKNQLLTPNARGNITRTPMSLRNVSSMKRTPSSTNISNIPGSSKRKLAPPSNRIQPSAKRSLYTQLKSPSSQLRPTTSANKTPFKSPMKRIRVVASTIIKRRSGRLNSSAKKRRSKATPGKAPKIYVNEDPISSDTCYDLFEEHIEKDPACRSSLMCENKPPNTTQINKNKQKSTNTRLLRTPSKINLFEQASLMRKSPSIATLSRTASPAGSSRKLTTKNLPIII